MQSKGESYNVKVLKSFKISLTCMTMIIWWILEYMGEGGHIRLILGIIWL